MLNRAEAGAEAVEKTRTRVPRPPCTYSGSNQNGMLNPTARIYLRSWFVSTEEDQTNAHRPWPHQLERRWPGMQAANSVVPSARLATGYLLRRCCCPCLRLPAPRSPGCRVWSSLRDRSLAAHSFCDAVLCACVCIANLCRVKWWPCCSSSPLCLSACTCEPGGTTLWMGKSRASQLTLHTQHMYETQLGP